MKAMILAAGRGERMRPLTDETPKPLLEAGGKPLIQYHIAALSAAGIRQLVINHAWLGKLIEARLGNGRDFGVEISYSAEGEIPLETGGGIKKALPLLGDEPFIVVNADIWTDFDFARLPVCPRGHGHIVLVHNPPHNRQGDFALREGQACETNGKRYTYSGIGVFTREMFENSTDTIFPLAPLLRQAMGLDKITGELYTGRWIDIGTTERLAKLNRSLINK